MATPRGPGQLSRLWQAWKTLSLPWRRHRLAGTDLSGTTFWYMRPPGAPASLPLSAWRRIAQPPQSMRDYADLNLSPSWLQWLRHTRALPPSLDEQHADLVRQSDLRELARLADERWARKESYLAAPTEAESVVAEPVETEGAATRRGGSVKHVEEEAATAERKDGQMPPNADDLREVNRRATERKGGEQWQPQSWTPGAQK